MVSSYLTLYSRHIVAVCCYLALLLRTAPQQTLPRSVRSTHVFLLRAEVLMTSAYPLRSTGSTLVLTPGP
jgi:hypothetical protein